MKVGLIDYGAGNLRSIKNALTLLKAETLIVEKPEQLADVDAIILPGVGNFGDAMEKLKDFRKPLEDAISSGVPFMGLCLGIQILLEGSDESPGAEGLGIFEGRCERLPRRVKIPHMGWNALDIVRDDPILGGLKDGDDVYFVHSYFPNPKDKRLIIAETDYGLRFPSLIGDGTVYATQFHPEKSGKNGLKILDNFLSIGRK
ncbi:MAG: imidazole glycerol phosphate synthase subunit HisH [Candidatus Altiarchaeota archaeon]